MTDLSKLQQQEKSYLEQEEWLTKKLKEVKDNLFNVRAAIKEKNNDWAIFLFNIIGYDFIYNSLC